MRGGGQRNKVRLFSAEIFYEWKACHMKTFQSKPDERNQQTAKVWRNNVDT